MELVSAHYMTPPPVDQTLYDLQVVREQLGRKEPIRIRIGPEVYFPSKPQGYRSWRGLSWIVTVDSIAEGQILREVISKVFSLMEQRGPLGMLEGLNSLDEDDPVQEAGEMREPEERTDPTGPATLSANPLADAGAGDEDEAGDEAEDEDAEDYPSPY